MIQLPTEGRPGALAELGQTGGADVGRYVEAVDAFADAGAWGVKVQMLDPEALAARDALPYWQTTRYSDTQAGAFALAGVVPHDAWAPVRAKCEERGVAFVATPFDLAALDPLFDLAPDAVKIASGDLTYRALIQAVAERFTQVLLSTGAAYDDEIRSALRWCRVARGGGGVAGEVIPLACSLEYPTPQERANLARVRELADLTRCTVGYSDHVSVMDDVDLFGMGAAIGATGAVLAERHVAYGYANDAKVADLDMAVGPGPFSFYVEGLALGAKLAGAPDLAPHSGETAAREGARRSLMLVADLPAGHVLTDDDFVALRPCPPHATPPDHQAMLRGSTLAEPVKAGRVVAWRAREGSVTVDTEPVG